MKRAIACLALAAAAAVCASGRAAAQDATGVLCPAALDERNYDSKSSTFIVTGRHNWLFRTSTDMRTDFSLDRKTTDLMQRLVAMLDARGTKLVMLLIPTRGMVAFDEIDLASPQLRDYDARLAIRNFLRYLEALQKTGVIVPNVLGYAVSSQFDEPFFEPRDHHWSVSGARIAAYALADSLARQPEWADLPKGTYESAESGDTFVLNETFSGIMQDVCGVEFPERRIPIWSTHASGVENVSAESLFGDAGPSPVVIAGTSMSNKNGTDDFNFGGFFAEYSGVMPLNVGIDGGGTEEAILAYLRGDGFAGAPPRFLVWEMPGYYDLNSEAMLREAMAAIGGDCPDDAAIASAEVPAAAGEVALFDALPAGTVPEETYVSLHFSDLDLRRVDFRFAYDGGNERLKAERSGRGPRDGRFLMAADPSRTDALESVTLELPEGAQGTIDARLCRFPATPG